MLQGSVFQGSVFQDTVFQGSVFQLSMQCVSRHCVFQGSVGGRSAADRERVIFSWPDQHYTAATEQCTVFREHTKST